jgi:vacuolar protein sorting-associated protein 13A/C
MIQLKARVNGFQFVLVGDLQELPFVHMSTNEFEIAVNDWSGDVSSVISSDQPFLTCIAA